MKKLTPEFYCRDVLQVAPDLIGKVLVRNLNGQVLRHRIVEAEAYRGEEDDACHARFGKTNRNSVMYNAGGCAYVYLIYGMYWMFNIVTGPGGDPQAVLIRGVDAYPGPGKLTRALAIDKSFYGEDLVTSGRIWIESCAEQPAILLTPRIGIGYAGEPWKSIAWRYILDSRG